MCSSDLSHWLPLRWIPSKPFVVANSDQISTRPPSSGLPSFPMEITSGTLPLCILSLAIFIWTVRRHSSRSVVYTIPGPKSPSWIYGTPRYLRLLPGRSLITTHTGHIPQLFLEYGKHEFQWQDTYGPVYAIKGCFGASPRPASSTVN